ETVAKRRANAAIALLRMGRPERLWPLLKAEPDPRLRCLLVHWLAPMGADPATLIQRLRHEPDDSIPASLLLALGGYGESALPADRRAELEPTLLDLFRNHPSAAVHAASGWLLRTWGRSELVRKIDQDLAGRPRDQRGWYLNGIGQTMVVIPAPGRFLMGAPAGEEWWKVYEAQHPVQIPYPYDLSATEVTVAQFQAFLDENPDFLENLRKRRESFA